MDEPQEIQNITESDKALAELNKAFFVSRAESLHTQSLELIKASIVYAKDAIRLLFFLHGACATAIVALGKIGEYRQILFLLGMGACLAVASSGLAYIAQRFYGECFQKDAENCFIRTYEAYRNFLRPDALMGTSRKKNFGWRYQAADIASLGACTAWLVSLLLFVSVVNIFHNM